MKIIKRGNKYVLYDDNGRVVIITSYRRICEGMMNDDT
jgi:hypothetical protein